VISSTLCSKGSIAEPAVAGSRVAGVYCPDNRKISASHCTKLIIGIAQIRTRRRDMSLEQNTTLEQITNEYQTNKPTTDYNSNKPTPVYRGLELLETKQMRGGTGNPYWK
jgi:hypothetical protein